MQSCFAAAAPYLHCICVSTSMCTHTGLMSVAIRVLWPRMRRRSGRLGGHGAPGSSRIAILNALTALQPPELAPLLQLNVQPLGAALQQPAGLPDSGAGVSTRKADEHDRCATNRPRCLGCAHGTTGHQQGTGTSLFGPERPSLQINNLHCVFWVCWMQGMLSCLKCLNGAPHKSPVCMQHAGCVLLQLLLHHLLQ